MDRCKALPEAAVSRPGGILIDCRDVTHGLDDVLVVHAGVVGIHVLDLRRHVRVPGVVILVLTRRTHQEHEVRELVPVYGAGA